MRPWLPHEETLERLALPSHNPQTSPPTPPRLKPQPQTPNLELKPLNLKLQIPQTFESPEREFFTGNLLIGIHFITEMI